MISRRRLSATLIAAGGLLLATFGTLTFVPAFFSFMHRKDPPHRPKADEYA